VDWNSLTKQLEEFRERCASDPALRARLDKSLAGLAEARAQEEAREALLREVTLVLSGSGVHRVLELVMDSVVRLSGAQRGFLLLARPDGSQEVAAARNTKRATVNDAATEVSRRVIETVLSTGRTLRLEDALHTRPFDLAESVARLKLLSVLCVPIQLDGRTLGALYLENRTASGVFTEESERLIGDFAGRIAAAVAQAESFDQLRRERERLEAQLAREYEFEGIVGRSREFRRLLDLIARAAESDIPILIEGESGTGKELVARAVHQRSPRRERPFVAVNCAALPQALLESELFGHTRGAFTGAARDRRGLFASADHGTLFLDEVGEMPAELQAKLLRVLQSGEYRAVGSDRPAMADVRIVAATQRRLEEEVKAGRFREDLYFRLKGVCVTVPPLRARKEDIPALIARFLEQFHPAGPLTLSDEARACLLTYDYPGNVRELESIIRRAVLFAEAGTIPLSALPPEVADRGGEILRLPVHVPTTAAELLCARKQATAEAARQVERAFLLRALEAAGGRPTEAARLAGMNRTQFQRLMARHDLACKRNRRATRGGQETTPPENDGARNGGCPQ